MVIWAIILILCVIFIVEVKFSLWIRNDGLEVSGSALGHVKTILIRTGDVTTNATTGDVTTGDVATGDVATGDVTTGDFTTSDFTTSDVTTSDATTSDVITGDVSTASAPTVIVGVDPQEIEAELFKELIDYEGRPMPPALSMLLENRSTDDDELQECMKEFADCMHVHKFYPFCAISEKLKTVRKFDSICEFHYILCRDGEGSWKYAMDEDCDQDVVEKVIKQVEAEAATRTTDTEHATETEHVDIPKVEPSTEEQETAPIPPEFGGETSEGVTTEVVHEAQNDSDIAGRMKRYYRALEPLEN